MLKKLNLLFSFIFIVIMISNFVNADFNEKLDFSAMKSKSLNLDINVNVPVYITNYSSDNTFIFKTHTFYSSRTQNVNFKAYYLNSDNEKVFGEVIKDKYGNDVVIFNIDEIKQSEFIFKIEGNIKSENKIVFNTKKYNLNNDINNDNSEVQEDIEKYKLASKYITSNESEILTLAQSIKKSDYALEELVNITNWIHTNIIYDSAYANTVENATTVLELRRGVCDELAILEAAILRSRGYPVKYIVGIANTTVNWGPHAWLEVFIPTQGWIPVDPTYNEVGLVDSSHIILAKVLDPSECEDKVTTKNNINIDFGSKVTSVNILNQKSFEDLGYDSYVDLKINNVEKLKPNSLFEIKVNLKNTTANPIALSSVLLINDEFKLLKPKAEKQVILLDAFSGKDITYYTILPDTTQPMYYNFKVSTQLNEKEDSIIIDPSEDLFYDAFFVLDPLVYFIDGNLFIDTEVINYTDNDKEINLMFDTNLLDINGNVLSSLNDSETNVITPNTRIIISKNLGVINSGNLNYVVSGDYNYSKIINILPDLKVKIENVDDILSNVDNNSSQLGINKSIIESDTNIWEDINDSRINSKSNINITIFIFFLVAFILCLVLLIIFKSKK